MWRSWWSLSPRPCRQHTRDFCMKIAKSRKATHGGQHLAQQRVSLPEQLECRWPVEHSLSCPSYSQSVKRSCLGTRIQFSRPWTPLGLPYLLLLLLQPRYALVKATMRSATRASSQCCLDMSTAGATDQARPGSTFYDRFPCPSPLSLSLVVVMREEGAVPAHQLRVRSQRATHVVCSCA